MSMRVTNVATGARDSTIEFLLEAAKKDPTVRLLVLYPRLDAPSLLRSNSVLTPFSRRLLACIRHGELLTTLKERAARLGNVIVREVCEV